MKLSGIAKFLALHAKELLGTATVLRTIVSALPIGRDDKAKIDAILTDIEKASGNIAKSAPSFEEAKITIKRSDVDAAVARVLPGVVAAELKKLGIQKVGNDGKA